MKQNSKNTPTLWLWGHHAVMAAIKNTKRQFHEIIITEKTARDLNLDEDTLKKRSPQVRFVDGRFFDKQLPEGAVHQGIAAHVAPLHTPDVITFCENTNEDAKVVILDQVTDPHNVGAILRSAAALGAKALIMTDKNSPPLSGVLAKSACGALEVIPVFQVTNLSRTMEDIKKVGFWTVGLDEHAPATIAQAKLSGKLALVMGAEGPGLRRLTREGCDIMVKLPTQSDFSTLNVSVATSLALYELVRQ